MATASGGDGDFRRGIDEVFRPREARGIRLLNGLDLFSGIGGITLALNEWVSPVAYCENDRYAQSVLLSRMADGGLPKAPIWDDVRSLQASDLPPVDIITAGFPCQDISVAGARIGMGGERSGLFFEVMRLAEECIPSFIFLENVPGVRKYLGHIARELAALRYDCRWGFISAYDVGAPQIRERWFCLAYANSETLWIKQRRSEGQNRNSKALDTSNGDKGLTTWSRQRGFEPLLFGSGDGIPFAVDRDRVLGNAVVPAQAREAFKRLIGFN